ncbi:hypothetical protein PR202_ga27823 [Eleusine coracana subsp. coracana]|uniref:Protein kinase domain-containing protein n=1 Tax=Eleusine coracana subsp. coracana TaxID=191504 RepID=A0AAV5DHN4_ELECO|nr:hypothetical protein PR202_ga27823 [Eleusine coracana subsp. coracana]
MVAQRCGGSFSLLLLLGGAALLAEAARVAFSDVTMSPPPSPSPAAETPFVPDVAFPPAAIRIHTEQANRYQRQILLAVILALVVVIVMMVSAIFAWAFWRKSQGALHSKDIKTSNATKRNMLLPVRCKLNSSKMSKKEVIAMMDYSFLELATGKFNEKNILGKGGFGCVYRAYLDRSHVAAVKKLNCCREEIEKEFENELDFLGKIQHPNVISVLGYCIHDDTRLLTYELMQNGSLETQLHGPSNGSALSWHTRLKIALDISDFGLAICGGNLDKCAMMPSGTVGYVAPEYLLDGQLTEKSDVYAFGVVLLELLLGRKPVEMIGETHCQSIVSWAMPQITDRAKLPSIIDPVVRNTMDLRHLYQVAAVAVLCVQPEPSYIPLIADVLHSLVPLVPVELGGTLRVLEHSYLAG